MRVIYSSGEEQYQSFKFITNIFKEEVYSWPVHLFSSMIRDRNEYAVVEYLLQSELKSVPPHDVLFSGVS